MGLVHAKPGLGWGFQTCDPEEGGLRMSFRTGDTTTGRRMHGTKKCLGIWRLESKSCRGLETLILRS